MSDMPERLLDNHTFLPIDAPARNISSIRNINCIPRTIIEPSTTVAVEVIEQQHIHHHSYSLMILDSRHVN